MSDIQNPDNHQAHLSIGGLSRLSGVAVETLRTWERRYGFPTPVRLASGHRRYPSDTVPRVRLVKRATELGFKASFAVMAPIDELETAVREAEANDPNGSSDQFADFEREIDRWMALAEKLDAARFDVAVRRAWSRHGARDFIVHQAIPFLHRVGNRWFDKVISVAHEHFTSEHLTSFLSAQWRPISKEAASGKAVVSCLEGDRHHLGIHMAAVFLAINHFEVIFLGPSTPIDDIIIATRETGVVTVVIGLAATTDLKRAEQRLRQLREAVPTSITIVVGGNDALPPIKGVTFLESLDAFADFAHSLADIYSGTA